MQTSFTMMVLFPQQKKYTLQNLEPAEFKY